MGTYNLRSHPAADDSDPNRTTLTACWKDDNAEVDLPRFSGTTPRVMTAGAHFKGVTWYHNGTTK